MPNLKLNHMTKILTSIFLVSLVSIVACGQTTTKQESGNNYPQTNSDWKTLDQSNYTIQYPSTWELNQSGQMGTSFVLFSPLESDKDKFKENVNLLIQDLTGQNIDLDKYTEISEGQIKTMITNSALMESKRIKNGKDEYHKIIYSGDQGIFHLQFEQYYWVINDKAFVLTFTSEKDKFADFREIGEKILNSFIHKK
jgi:hypothetical protein